MKICVDKIKNEGPLVNKIVHLTVGRTYNILKKNAEIDVINQVYPIIHRSTIDGNKDITTRRYLEISILDFVYED